MPRVNRKKGERRSKSPPPGHDRDGKHQSSSNKRSGHTGGGDRHKQQNQGFEMLNSMVSGFARTGAAKFTSGLGLGDNKEDREQAGSTKPGEFDIYLFAQSWAPRFCCSNEKQCKKEGMLGSDDLSPHGLWPAFYGADKKGRTYPAFCREDICKDKNRAAHEWIKHGTCTLLDRNSYFEEEEKLTEKNENILKLSDLLNSLAGERIAVTELHEEAGGKDYEFTKNVQLLL